MATELKPTSKATSQQVKPGPILDTAGGEMPNPKAPPHGPTEQELTEVLKTSEEAPDSEGDLADHAEREIENDIRGDIDRARGNLRH